MPPLAQMDTALRPCRRVFSRTTLLVDGGRLCTHPAPLVREFVLVCVRPPPGGRAFTHVHHPPTLAWEGVDLCDVTRQHGGIFTHLPRPPLPRRVFMHEHSHQSVRDGIHACTQQPLHEGGQSHTRHASLHKGMVQACAAYAFWHRRVLTYAPYPLSAGGCS